MKLLGITIILLRPHWAESCCEPSTYMIQYKCVPTYSEINVNK